MIALRCLITRDDGDICTEGREYQHQRPVWIPPKDVPSLAASRGRTVLGIENDSETGARGLISVYGRGRGKRRNSSILRYPL